MMLETELTLRNILATDTSIREEDVQRAIGLLRGDGGRVDAEDSTPKVMRMKEAVEFLGVCQRTLNDYLKKGYLKRAYSSSTASRAFGIERESVLRFKARRLERRCV